MPPKVKISEKEIINAALSIVRSEGADALNARRLAGALSCSTQPIFSNFASMEELQEAVLSAANALYESYLATDMAEGKYPPYKASGLAYIRFASEEKELFKLLFMRDRSGEAVAEDRQSIAPLLSLIMMQVGLSEDEAYLFHLELWLFVHGIATMVATSYLNWDAAFISGALTDAYLGLKLRYQEKKVTSVKVTTY